MKTYVNEAFWLARQMLDLYQDARGISAFRPDKDMFCALLEGTKRIRDLGQARWIMAEMVRGGKKGGDPNEVDTEIDEELIMHIFNMYAAYTPWTSSLVVADQSKTMDTSDTSKVTIEVTAGVAIDGPQADSSSLSALSLVLEGENQNQPSFTSCHRATLMSSENSKFSSTEFCETAAMWMHCYSLLTLR